MEETRYNHKTAVYTEEWRFSKKDEVLEENQHNCLISDLVFTAAHDNKVKLKWKRLFRVFI